MIDFVVNLIELVNSQLFLIPLFYCEYSISVLTFLSFHEFCNSAAICIHILHYSAQKQSFDKNNYNYDTFTYKL